MIENQVPNQAINPQFNQNTSAEINNTVEDIIVPVVTANQESNQYVVIKTVSNEEFSEINGEISANGAMSVNDEWSANSMFPELDEDLDLTAHNPLEVTGQVNEIYIPISTCIYVCRKF